MSGKSKDPDHTPAEKPHYHGHRERFRSASPDAPSDYELLEMVLFCGDPAPRHQAARQGAPEEFRLVCRGYPCPRGALARSRRHQGRLRQPVKQVAAAASRIAKGEIRRSVALSSWA
jgi:DNA repair protein RadC